MTTPKIRLTVDLPASSCRTLGKLAKKEGTTITEALRKAIAHTGFLYDKTAEGYQIILDDGRQIKQLILP